MQSAAATAATAPCERLTWTEICARHPDEWVLLVDVDWIDRVNYEFRSAVVLSHARGRREVFDRVRPLLPRYPELAHYYTGSIRAPHPLWKLSR